ncbi:MAG: aminotransferase class IV [Phycisphaerales bacterium]|nr:aminotransferase class IV [Phycisphaerales bacterium]
MADSECPAVVHLDGEITPTANARVHVFDRGFLFGDGVYELVRVFAGTPLAMSAHVRRLGQSLDAARIRGFDPEQYRRIVDDLLAEQGLEDATVYIQVTRGPETRRHHVPAEDIAPTVFAFALPAPPLETLEHPTTAEVILLPDERWHRCEIKAIGLMPNVLAGMQADQDGASEAILHRDGLVSEGTHSNVLLAIDGVLVTPPAFSAPSILDGTMRNLAIDVAREAGMAVEERPVPVEELRQAEEIALTSSRKILHVVTRLDDRPLPGKNEAGSMMHEVFTRMRDAIAATVVGRGIPAAR